MEEVVGEGAGEGVGEEEAVRGEVMYRHMHHKDISQRDRNQEEKLHGNNTRQMSMKHE